jgi:anti-sigma-K factor RskA
MTAELHTLTGAYALDAVSDVDRAEFERHLGECVACRQEVAELRATGARLAAAAAVDPPPGLKLVVLADVARTRQLPPRVAGPRGPARRRPGDGKNGRDVAWPPAGREPGEGPGWPVDGREPGGGTGWPPAGREFAGGEVWPPGAREPAAGPEWLPGGRELGRPGRAVPEPSRAKALQLRAALLGAAAAAVVAVVLGVATAPAPVDSVLAAPDASAIQGVGRGHATLVVSRSRHQAVLLASDLPALDAGHVYQVWLIGTGGARSAGLMTSEASQRMLVADLPAGVDRIGVTVEPAGGSPGPTTPAVTRIDLT